MEQESVRLGSHQVSREDQLFLRSQTAVLKLVILGEGPRPLNELFSSDQAIEPVQSHGKQSTRFRGKDAILVG